MEDLQKANMWKRISAALFDLILVAILAVGFTFLMTVLVGYNARYADYEDARAQYDAHIHTYEEAYGANLNINTQEELDAMSPEERAQYDIAYDACVDDPKTMQLRGAVEDEYTLLVSLILVSVTFGILVAYLLYELLLPLLLRNGQTPGKKIFGLAVIRVDGVRVTPFQVAVRTVLGKYTIETMIPVFVLVMMFFGTWDGLMFYVGLLILLALLIGQIALLIATRARTPIHDLAAGTYVVDYQSQRIFDTVEEREAYYRRLHEEIADREAY